MPMVMMSVIVMVAHKNPYFLFTFEYEYMFIYMYEAYTEKVQLKKTTEFLIVLCEIRHFCYTLYFPYRHQFLPTILLLDPHTKNQSIFVTFGISK